MFVYLAAPGLSCGVWWDFQLACGIWFPDQGQNLSHLHWECGVLALTHQASPQITVKDYIMYLRLLLFCLAYCECTVNGSSYY